MNLNVEEVYKFVARVLSAERFEHTLGVADWAEKLAKQHGLDPVKSRCAALAHDLAKEIPIQEQLNLARQWDLIRYPEDEQTPSILHGYLAAYWLEHFNEVDDQEVLDAVANHTLGRPGMSRFEMLIYSADMTEPKRKFPKVDNLRRSLYDDLEKGTLNCVEHTLLYLRKRKSLIHPLTQLTYEDLQRRINLGTGSKNN